MLTCRRFYMDRLEQADSHHLRDSTGIIAIRLIDRGRENSMYVAGFDANRGKVSVDETRVDLLRQSPGLQADALKGTVKLGQPLGYCLRVAIHCRFEQHVATLVQDTNGGGLHGNVEAGKQKT